MFNSSLLSGFSVLRRQSVRTIAQLRGRPYLPGSNSPKCPELLSGPRKTLPFTVKASDVGITSKATASECAAACQDSFETNLEKYGAILYRGFPLDGPEDFAAFYDGLGKFKAMDYVGGAAPRQQVGKKAGVYTASDEPPRVSMDLHNEMAYMAHWPRLILFYCLHPADPGCGGESAISDVREIRSKLDKDVVDKFVKSGIRYNYNWCDKKSGHYKSWQEVFITEDRSEVEEYLSKNADGFAWEDDGSCAVWNTRPATMKHPTSGTDLWFNHATRKHGSYWKCHPTFEVLDLPYSKMPTHSYYGDGSEIPEDVIQHIRDVSWQCAVGFQMQKADLMVLENQYVQHSRLSFTGKRKLLAAMLKNA